MNAWFDWVSAWEPEWSAFAARALTDGTVAFVVVSLVWLALRRWLSPRVGYLMFGLVMLKLANPFELAGPAWLAWLSPASWFSAPEVTPTEVVPTGAVVFYPIVDEPVVRSMTAMEWLFLGWLAIVALLFGRLVLQQVRIGRIVRAARPVAAHELTVDLEELQKLAGVDRRVRWLVTDAVESPATGGLLRPFVLLPRGLTSAIEPAALRWVLLHELAHVRRRDVHAALVQRIVSILLFFHPLVWWTNRMIDEQREFACDEAAPRGQRRAAQGMR